MNHLTLLQKGIESWNQWRDRHPNTACNLEGQDLSHGYFFEGNFSGVNLKNANLQRACFVGANFQGADLSGADFSGAYLADANFYGANLSHANLSNTDLDRADMREANLLGTQMVDVDLRHTKLPNASVSPYGHQVAALLTQTSSAPAAAPSPTINNQPHPKPLPSKQPTIHTESRESVPIEFTANTTHSPESSKSAKSAAKQPPKQRKQSLWHSRSIKLFGKETAETLAERQQRIRLSAIPTSSKISASAKKAKNSAIKPKPNSRANPGHSVTTQSSAEIASKKSSSDKSSSRWGRRQADQTFNAKLSRLLSQKTVWAPTTLAAAGLMFAISWPTLTSSIAGSPNLNNEGTSQTVITAEASSLALVKSLTGESQIWSIATQRLTDGTTQVLAGESNGDIQIWDSETGKTIRTLSGHSNGVRSLAISQSGQWLVSGDRTELKVWNPTSGQLVHSIPVTEIAGGNSTENETENITIANVAIAPDDTTFISSTQSGRITAWDMASGTQRYSLDNGSDVWSIAIAPNSRSFVSGNSDRTIHQRDLTTGRLLQEFTGHSDAVRAVAISPDGQTLASGSWDQTIKLWNLATGDLQTTLSGHTDQIFSLAISPDGQTLASSSTDRTLKLWDLPNRELTKTLDENTESVVTVAFAATDSQANNSVLISGGRAQTVNIWK